MDVHFSQCDFGYLRPPKEVFDVIHTEHYIRHGEGKKAVRKIFCNGKFYDDELAKLEEFKALIASENVVLPSDWTENDTFRYMYSGKLDLKKSLKILKGHMEWRSQPERGVIGRKAQKLMEDGIMYISGRDKQFRPIIVVNAYKADLKKNDMKDFTQTISFILDVAKKYYFVPGKVENWVIIIESNGAGVLDFPTKLVKAINDVTAGNYSSTLDKLYIMNPSSFLKKSWSLVQGLLDPETATKINMLTKEEFPQLLDRISRDQIEQCYGGTLPARTVYWPPLNTLNKPPYTEDPASTAQSQQILPDGPADNEATEEVKNKRGTAVIVSNAAAVASVVVDVVAADQEEEKPLDKSLDQIEEWNFKGREETRKATPPHSTKLDDSDERVEIGEIKQSAAARQTISSPLKSSNKALKNRDCEKKDSRSYGNTVLEENEPGSAICGFCSPGSSQDEASSNQCNIF